jgi:hypothetical protein
MMRTCVAALVFGFAAAMPVLAQAPTPTPAQAVAPAPTVAAKAPRAPTEKCMRLPLSDIAFGRDGTIAQTRMRLDEYAQAERAKRGWGALTKSRETIDCEVYLVLPVLGTEYKCLITATFCAK